MSKLAVSIAILAALTGGAEARPLLTKDQAVERAVDVLIGNPYGLTRTAVRSHISDAVLIKSGATPCGPASTTVWRIDVEVPDQNIAGAMLIDARSGKEDCIGLPYLD